MELTLTQGQYELVYNAFSFVIAAMGAAAVFFLLSRNRVAPRHRMALTLSTLVVLIAGYHYFRIFDSWANGFIEVEGSFVSNGSFNEGYRYVDWLLTVPLLLAELVVVMKLAKEAQFRLIARLGIASALMIILGYPGEVATDAATKWVWWTLGMVPFAYILYVLFGELGQSISRQSERVATLVKGLRTLLLFSWLVYPVAFLLPLTGLSEASAEVFRQVGYSIADVVAKPVFGILIYLVARAKSEEDGFDADVENSERVALAS